MKNKKKYIIFALLIVFFLCSCQNKKITEGEVIYPKFEKIDYNKMESYNAYITKDNLNYKYTFYFEDNVCMNALVSISFDDEITANKYYEIIKNDDLYIDIVKKENIVTYYHNPENFIYMLYSKDIIFELLKENNFSSE